MIFKLDTFTLLISQTSRGIVLLTYSTENFANLRASKASTYTVGLRLSLPHCLLTLSLFLFLTQYVASLKSLPVLLFLLV